MRNAKFSKSKNMLISEKIKIIYCQPNAAGENEQINVLQNWQGNHLKDNSRRFFDFKNLLNIIKLQHTGIDQNILKDRMRITVTPSYICPSDDFFLNYVKL